MSDTTHRALRLALASLLAAAMVAQLAIGMSRNDLTVVRFFSSFNVLSNTFAAVMLALLAFRPDRDNAQGFAALRGAVTVYMSVTGLVYALILAPEAANVGLTEPWVDWSLHVIGPIAIALDWLVDAPRVRLPSNSPAIWLAFPAAYLVYTLVRGPIAEWYPYPILDPGEVDGYRGVALWSFVVLAVIVGFGLVYHWWANRRSPRPQVA
jgi:hypothetical protein